MTKPLQEIARDTLLALGEDPEREGLRGTPRRVAEAWKHITRGYAEDAEQVLRSAVFTEEVRDMIIVKDIELYSVCEHHLLPFFGRCHVGYLPTGKVVGVSKIARVVDIYARRLQLQERLTNQIADAIMRVLEPAGVAVVIEAKHLCMMMRGVEKQNSSMVTSAMLGSFRESNATRSEFLALTCHPKSP